MAGGGRPARRLGVFDPVVIGPGSMVCAGWGFVTGKTASCAAMALTFGTYAAPGAARWLAVAAVIALVAVNLSGIERTAAVTRMIVAIVLASLVCVVAASLGGGRATIGGLDMARRPG